MRAIEFRGKRVDNGEWAYGFLVLHPGSAFILETGYPIQNGDFYAPPKWWCSVDPSTIGQFTGLWDKNGRQIYEGDILRDTRTGNIESVEYAAPTFVLVDSHRYFYWTYHADEYEVIGNVHEALPAEGVDKP